MNVPIKQLAQLVKDNGGVTFADDTINPPKGYVVEDSADGTVTDDTTLGNIRRVLSEQARNSDAFGAWICEDGKLHVGPSTFFTVKREAIREGKRRGEIAIFDLKKMEEIAL